MERWFWGDGGELCFSSALFGSGCNYMAPPSVLINAPLQRQRCYRPRQSKTKHYQQCPALREDGWLCTIDTHLKWLFAFQILQQHCTHFQMSKQLGIKEYKFFFFFKGQYFIRAESLLKYHSVVLCYSLVLDYSPSAPRVPE